MPNIKVNTSKLISDGTRLVELSKSYNSTISNFFTMMRTSIVKGWSGEMVTKYVSSLKNDEEFFKKMGKDIAKYGNTMINDATKLQVKINSYEEELNG